MVARVTCPLSLPYCNQGVCGNEPSSECEPILGVTEKRSDLCPGTGFYPDPRHCSHFNYCTEEFKAISHICPQLYAYDPVTGMCKFHQKAEDCPFIDCQSHGNRFVTYPLDRTVYSFCALTKDEEKFLLYQCPENMIFSEELQQCVFDCLQGEGKFEYPGNERKFFLCLKDSFGKVRAPL